jgi:hypothetical protein
MSSFKEQETKYIDMKTRELNNIKDIFSKNKDKTTNKELFKDEKNKLSSILIELKSKHLDLLQFKEKLIVDVNCLNKRHTNLTNKNDIINNSITSTGKLLKDTNLLYNKHLINKYNLVVGSIILALLLFYK